MNALLDTQFVIAEYVDLQTNSPSSVILSKDSLAIQFSEIDDHHELFESYHENSLFEEEIFFVA